MSLHSPSWFLQCECSRPETDSGCCEEQIHAETEDGLRAAATKDGWQMRIRHPREREREPAPRDPADMRDWCCPYCHARALGRWGSD